MANTRQSQKRARQAETRRARNRITQGLTRSALKNALDVIKSKDATKFKDAYATAVKALSKAASKGAIPKGRAARKISRLTKLAKKVVPAALPKSK
jgi:small subunit ribosomal protein S20